MNFGELLKVYVTLTTSEEKVAYVAQFAPADVLPLVLLALESQDEVKFNEAMASAGSSEPAPIQIDPECADECAAVADAADGSAEVPVVDTPDALPVETNTLPEGPVDSLLTEEEASIIAPTVGAVAEMTDAVKDSTPEQIEALPEEIKEGVEIWKDASEDFTKAIMARTVARLHKGDFSVIEAPSDGEILATGAQVAKELVGEGAHKTSLDRAVEDIQAEVEDKTTADLVRIYHELKEIEDAAGVFVNYIADKDELEMTGATKDRVIAEVLDNGLLEKDGSFNSSLLSALNTSKDYSARPMNERMKIHSDFSEVEVYADDGSISDDTAAIINEAGSFEDALDAVVEALEERGVEVEDSPRGECPECCPVCGEVECVCEKGEEEPEEIGVESGNTDDHEVGEKVEEKEEEKKDDEDFSEASDQAGLVAQNLIRTGVTAESQNRAQTSLGGRNAKDAKYSNKGFAPSRPVRTNTQLAVKRITDEKINNEGKIAPIRAINKAINKKRWAQISNEDLQNAYSLPTIGAISGSAIDAKFGTGNMVETLGRDVGDMILAGKLNKNFSEEAPVEEQAATEQVVEQGLGGNDMIQALVEKYRMLPTLETKNFMIEDLRVKGFDESIIQMIQSQADGNFSEVEAPLPPEAVAQEQQAPVDPAMAQAPVEEAVAVDIFDSLLGAPVGMADPMDGTLAPGEVAANGGAGASIFEGLATGGNAYPMADPTGEARRAEVAAAEQGSMEVEDQIGMPPVDGDDFFEKIV